MAVVAAMEANRGSQCVYIFLLRAFFLGWRGSLSACMSCGVSMVHGGRAVLPVVYRCARALFLCRAGPRCRRVLPCSRGEEIRLGRVVNSCGWSGWAGRWRAKWSNLSLWFVLARAQGLPGRWWSTVQQPLLSLSLWQVALGWE